MTTFNVLENLIDITDYETTEDEIEEEIWVEVLGHKIRMSEEMISCYRDADYELRNRRMRDADMAMDGLAAYFYLAAHDGEMPFTSGEFLTVWGDHQEFFQHIHAQLKNS